MLWLEMVMEGVVDSLGFGHHYFDSDLSFLFSFPLLRSYLGDHFLLTSHSHILKTITPLCMA